MPQYAVRQEEQRARLTQVVSRPHASVRSTYEATQVLRYVALKLLTRLAPGGGELKKKDAACSADACVSNQILEEGGKKGARLTEV